MLKYKINAEDFEKLNDVEKTFYAQSDEGFQLQVEGAADKGKLDEFRATNVDLLKQQELYKGVDLEKFREYEESDRKIRDKELIEKGEFDTLVSERTNSMKSGFESQLKTVNEQLEAITGKYNSTVSQYEIEKAVSSAVSGNAIKSSLFGDVATLVKSKFTVDNGQVVAKDGETILAGADGNLTVDEYVAGLDESYKIQSNGGLGNGNSKTDAVKNNTARRDAYAKIIR